MKTNYRKTTVLSLILFAMLMAIISGSTFGQTETYTYEVKNDTVLDATHFRFTIWMKSNSGTINFRSAQFTLWICQTFVNGTATVAYVAGSSDISTTNIFGTPNFGTPSAGGTPPGTGGDTSIIKINNTGIACPGYSLVTTWVRWGEFEVTRTGTGSWGCSVNKLGFYSGSNAGNKITSNISIWTTCPSQIILPTSNGTYLNNNLNNQTPVVTVPPSAASACANSGTINFSVSASNANSGSPAITYQWRENNSLLSNGGMYGNVNTATLTITNPSLLLNGNSYSCTMTQCGTITSGSAILTVNPLPVVSFTGLAASYSVNSPSVTLTGSPSGGTFTGPGISASAFTPSAAGIGGPYTITYSYTDGNGCNNISSHQTSVVNCTLPSIPGAITVTGGSANVCPGNMRTYSVTQVSGITYNWTPPTGGSINSGQGTNNISVTYGAAFTLAGPLSVTAQNTCGTSAPRNLTVNRNNPTATITTTGPTTFCSGTNPLTLTANAGTGLTYQWKKGSADISGASNQSYVPTTSSTMYKVVVNNTAGCSKTSATVAVTVNPLPTATITLQGPTTFCSGTNPLTLTANSGTSLTYQWKKGSTSISGATGQSYIPTTSSTMYKVVVSSTSGCTKTSAIVSVTVNPLPAATITPQGPTTFCAGGSVVLQANSGTGLTYQWKKGTTDINGATLQNYIATTGGTYKVTVTNANSCSKLSAGKVVTVNCRLNDESDKATVMEIFPNPTDGMITLKFTSKENQNCELVITDISGRKVLSEDKSVSIGLNSYKLNLSNIPKGIYILEIKSANSNSRTKVVVE